ncbi:MAG TPA: D-2-hydroxyacid dehydrogenase [Beijerinckiaceae bacterium]|jgi:phosphoglycerate dehydrogenase-like enzyme
MTSALLPARDKLSICFAHAAYQLGDEFSARGTGINHFELRSLDELQARIGEADVLVVSGLWRNELLERAGRLRFIQSISAGTDQYARDALRAKGVRLASAQGANERAVAEHAIALILALARQLPQARDNQARRTWRGMIADRTRREDELGGKTLVIVGLGRIGARLAALTHAFGMRVIGVRRSTGKPPGGVDAVVAPDRLPEVLPEADFVALTCPLTPETEGLIGAPQLSAMKPTAYLINVARGRVVDEAAMLTALQDRRIAGASLDCFHDEPLPPSSPLWAFENVIITPHSAGETRRYETNVVDLLIDNLERLLSGNPALRNEIV